jgi:hypothetical protein
MATLAGVRLALRHVLAPPAAHVPVAPVVSAQAMADPAAVVVLDSAVVRMARATARMRPQMARLAAPLR